jgi:hypothetical protein
MADQGRELNVDVCLYFVLLMFDSESPHEHDHANPDRGHAHFIYL